MPTLTLSRTAEKEFVKLQKSEQKKVNKKLNALRADPFAGKNLTGDLDKYYSLRAWPYRIIYSFDKEVNEIKVKKIEHRQGVYSK